MLEERVAQSFARQGLMRHLRARLLHASNGECAIEAEYSEHLSQQHGFFHAGVTSSLADTAAGYAALTVMPADASVVTVEFKINLVAPAKGECLRTSAHVIRAGRTLVVVGAKAEVLNEQHWHTCAEFLGTMFTLRDVSESAVTRIGA